MNPQACREWQEALGEVHVLHKEDQLASYQENTSAFERRIVGVLKPASVEDVQSIINIANVHRTPLYPISTGRNWGMGSRLPVEDGAVIVDLQRMRQIRSLDEEHWVAVIEPGVSQRQLYQHLIDRHAAATFNVTGSSPDTSLVGNTLERGVGYFSSRGEDVVWLEIVLGNGRIVRTGFAHFENASARDLYGYGLGPDLTGTFMQSNFGIVTAMGFKLMPDRGKQMAMLAKISDAGDFALTRLRKSGIVDSAIHIGNRARTRSTMAPLLAEQLGPGLSEVQKRAQAEAMLGREGFGPWSAVGGIFGSARQLATTRREIRSALAGIAQVSFLSDSKLALLTRISSALSFLPSMRQKQMMVKAITPLYGLSKGIPSQEPMKGVYWSAGQAVPEGPLNPDHGHAGVLYCLPVIPMSGQGAADAVRDTESVCAKHDFVAYITFNMINDSSLEGVINVAFDRSDAERVKCAHACMGELQERFVANGLLPYRLGIHEMKRFVSEDDPFWLSVRDLKTVFDPNHIIAPGRYNLV
ncbi:MAG: FAD-binding oxidoreductase [Verrucomicrobia bacterium]|nr:FAD-binding oxidoreductase [Verrucomicrobiota bacterium]